MGPWWYFRVTLTSPQGSDLVLEQAKWSKITTFKLRMKKKTSATPKKQKRKYQKLRKQKSYIHPNPNTSGIILPIIILIGISYHTPLPPSSMIRPTYAITTSTSPLTSSSSTIPPASISPNTLSICPNVNSTTKPTTSS